MQSPCTLQVVARVLHCELAIMGHFRLVRKFQFSVLAGFV